MTSDRKHPEQKPVLNLDLQKFMGRWYVISCIPTIFEAGAHNAIEKYTWNAEKDRVDIDFTFNKDSFNGPLKAIPQKGFIYNKVHFSEWRVQPWWPLKFTYLVIDVAPDYTDTIIGVPSRNYVWIMSRDKKMAEDRYQQLVDKIKNLGYDISKLKKVPHQ